MKCVNCKYCVNYNDGYYWCNALNEWDLIEECIANDENMECDLYDEDRNDDTTA